MIFIIVSLFENSHFSYLPSWKTLHRFWSSDNYLFSLISSLKIFLYVVSSLLDGPVSGLTRCAARSSVSPSVFTFRPSSLSLSMKFRTGNLFPRSVLVRWDRVVILMISGHRIGLQLMVWSIKPFSSTRGQGKNIYLLVSNLNTVNFFSKPLISVPS